MFASRRPPLDGSISVVPGLLDFHAEHNPNCPWAYLALDENHPVTSVSFLEYSRATHRVAHALRPGREGPENERVALLINCDSVLYVAMISGMIRAGLVPLLLSPRNSVPAIVNLLKQTNCHRIISQTSFSSQLSSVQSDLAAENYTLRVDDLPELQAIFPTLHSPSHQGDVQPYSAGPKHRMEEVAFYLHSSGSTGLPKPVQQRYIDMLHVSQSPVIRETRDRNVLWGVMSCLTFHAMGIVMHLYAPLATGVPAGLFAPRAPASPVIPTPQNTLQASRAIGCDGLRVVPAFVEAWAQSEDDVQFMKTMKIVVYAGGPLSSKVGTELVSAGVPLYPLYGGSEFGPQTNIFDVDDSRSSGPDAKTSADWEWLTFSDRVNLRMVPQGDGTYESQFLTCSTHWPRVENLSDTKGYATSDLWEPHPLKKGLWRITGRKDDVLVLGSGEKIVPIPQENLITISTAISAAVMFGRGKNQCGVLIEPSPEYTINPGDSDALAKYRNTIWPIIEEANQGAPTFSRIFKEMIIVADPSKPLIRSAKETIMRKHSLTLYEKEIDDLYRVVENSENPDGVAPPPTWTVNDLEAWLLSQAIFVAGGKVISISVDVFDQGFDSLHATFLRNRIVGALRADSQTSKIPYEVSQNFVYEHPTLRELAAAILELIDSGVDVATKAVKTQVVEMVKKYSDNLPRLAMPPPRANTGVTVLLTGSTGTLGSYMLATLLTNPRIVKVYTLNRPSRVPYDRQQAVFVEGSLDPRLLEDSKLVQLVGDLKEDGFGLEPAVFAEVKETVTHVIHNAWRVNFNHLLPAFESLIAGLRKLIDFCYTVPHAVKLLFTSSISGTLSWDVSLGPVPEDVVLDPMVTGRNGYGASKLVAEQILAKAADNGLQCTSLRLSQICGPKSTGSWQTREWVPALVKSGMALGALPNLMGNVSWVPSDAVANVMVDLVLTQESLPRVLNLVHPRPVVWRTLMQDIIKSIEVPLAIIPWAEWTAKVEEAGTQDAEIGRIPVIKILDFFRSIAAGEAHAVQIGRLHLVEAGGLPVYDTTKMQKFSPSLRALGVLDDTYAEAWVKYWKQIGYIH